MVRASQRTGLFYRLGATQLPSEMLLRVAIRLESANRIVFSNGRDQNVAFEHSTFPASRARTRSIAPTS